MNRLKYIVGVFVMKLKAIERYAVLTMLDIAIHQKSGPVALISIAKRHAISKSYLEQLIAQLRKNNLVASVRGPGGGYLIKEQPQKITVAHIIQAVDMNISQHDSIQTEYHARGQAASVMQLLWNELSLHTYRFLNTVTLSCLVEQIQSGAKILQTDET